MAAAVAAVDPKLGSSNRSAPAPSAGKMSTGHRASIIDSSKPYSLSTKVCIGAVLIAQVCLAVFGFKEFLSEKRSLTGFLVGYAGGMSFLGTAAYLKFGR